MQSSAAKTLSIGSPAVAAKASAAVDVALINSLRVKFFPIIIPLAFVDVEQCVQIRRVQVFVTNTPFRILIAQQIFFNCLAETQVKFFSQKP